MVALDILQDVIDRLADEGDRVYLGSTNDVERLKQVESEVKHLLDNLAAEARDLMRDLRDKAGA